MGVSLGRPASDRSAPQQVGMFETLCLGLHVDTKALLCPELGTTLATSTQLFPKKEGLEPVTSGVLTFKPFEKGWGHSGDGVKGG